MSHLPEGLPEPDTTDVEPWISDDRGETIRSAQAALIRWSRSYGLACYRAGLERAAKIVGSNIGGSEAFAEEYSANETLREIAAAIRSLKDAAGK